MNIVTNEIEGFIQVANEIGGLTSLIIDDTKLVGVKIVGDGQHTITLPTRRSDTRLNAILTDENSSYGNRHLYNNNDPHRIQFSFRGKPALVSALIHLGVDPKLLSAIKTAKVSEMKEFIDATAPKQIPENAEVSEIVLKLTSQNDRHTFKTRSVVIPEVTITMEIQGTCPTYFIIGNAVAYNTKFQQEALSKIQAATKLRSVAGSCDQR